MSISWLHKGARLRLATTAVAVVAVTGLGAVAAMSASAAPSPTASSSTTKTHKHWKGESGIVTAVTSDSITIKHVDESRETYKVNDKTKIFLGKSTALTLANIHPDDRVYIRGTKADKTIAAVIHVQMAHLGGIVTGVSGNQVTIIDREGFKRVINLLDSTKVTYNGHDATREAIVVGKHVRAAGKVAADDTSLNAVSVAVTDKAAVRPAPTASPAPAA